MEKIELEYEIKTSPRILYKMISTDEGLQQWFAKKVKITKDSYTFDWDGTTEVAKLLGMKENDHVKFRFANKPDHTFMEFKIKVDDLTKDVALLVVDFVDPDEKNETKELWNKQIEDLMEAIGL
ncbi:MAG: SRPBCC domain-containing protein [Bacteroidia bacterium]|nr:SRPBCC domain-containing protein [Bacteroidia bacterium]